MVKLQYGQKSDDKQNSKIQICPHRQKHFFDLTLSLLKKGTNTKNMLTFHLSFQRTGRTALMAACNSGSVKVCRAILEAGGDVNAVDKKGLHAAHEAAKGGFFECLVILAAYSAGFDVYTKELVSPLHLAAKGGT